MSSKFTEERYWLRARLEQGGYVKPPRVRMVVTNAIDAYNHETIRNETLGSSDGSPLQQFKFLRGPLLEDEVDRGPREADAAGRGDRRPRRRTRCARSSPRTRRTTRCWVRYKRVESFFASGPRSRHYTLDYVTGTIAFGDGRRGIVPPEGKNIDRRAVATASAAARSATSTRTR